MKIINKTLKSIKENPNLNKNFLSLKRNDFKLDCNILTLQQYNIATRQQDNIATRKQYNIETRKQINITN